jgi:hypothetical protein
MIHEVFYRKNGQIEAWSKDGMHPLGETMTQLKSDIRYMRRAFKLPVLEIKDKKLVEANPAQPGVGGGA